MNPEQLRQFKLVIWNNTSGDTLTEDQRAAFQAWMESGGSFFGIHGAGGDPVPTPPLFPPPRSVAVWRWYIETLLGAQFVVHSRIVPATIRIEDKHSPITKGLPEAWQRSDEWYSFPENPRSKPGFHVLATVDKKDLRAGQGLDGFRSPVGLVALRGGLKRERANLRGVALILPHRVPVPARAAPLARWYPLE